jgi:2-amino-4-hydroxy-6-hydroxymethyldihydropteridine diphosphokinase
MGSNLGDRRAHLRDALNSLPGIVAVSSVYETDPVGKTDQQSFLNLIVEIDTDLSPRQLLGVCHRLEAAAGRVRSERWGPRTLDVDIVWMEGVEIDDPQLKVPHAAWRDRRFVLAPMRELAPDLVSEKDVELADGRVRVSERFEDLVN